MMDYYSQMEMPGLDERKKDLLAYAYAKRKCEIPNEMLESIVTRIVSETKAYSLTGYSMYGVMDERSKLDEALKKFA
jgi:hypothetical protein